MGAARKIDIGLSAREIAGQIIDEVEERGGDRDEANAVLSKAMFGRYRHMHLAWAELVIDALDRPKPKMKSASKPSSDDAVERSIKRFANKMRREALAREADAHYKKRALIQLSVDCTMHDLAKLAVLGVSIAKKWNCKLGDRRNAIKVIGRKALEKAGCRFID